MFISFYALQEKAEKASLFRVGVLDMVQCGRVRGIGKLPSATLYTQPHAFFPLLHPPLLSKHFIYSLILKAKNLSKQYVQNVLMNFNSYINNRWQNTKLVSLAVVMDNLHLYGSPPSLSHFFPFFSALLPSFFRTRSVPGCPQAPE